MSKHRGSRLSARLAQIAEKIKGAAARLMSQLPLIADLPIKDAAQSFLDLVASNQVVIVQAETGSGKSTGLPALLVRAGYSVLHTQPRILAARGVASRLAQVLGERLGDVVGYRTGLTKDMDGPGTQCLVVTDGLAMVRRIMGHERWFDVVIIDEVHEWNTNIEVLIGWIKRQLKNGAQFKVVIMSATLEAQKLSDFFGGAPVLDIPGRVYPVEVRKPGASIEDDAAGLLRDGKNVLIFQPGKQEIQSIIDVLQSQVSKAVILPLHADLTPEEQQRCFKSYGKLPKCIVATNVAQTSITIPDIDAVVDSGLERRTEVRNGVEGLYLRSISQASSAQRKGRSARTKPGIYIDHCPDSFQQRPKFDMAEILRSPLDQTVLRLAASGVDLEKIELFHQPSWAEIRSAKRLLIDLGCMDEENRVTEIGHEVSRLPTGVRFGRMIVEGAKRGVLGCMLDVASIMEQGGIAIGTPKGPGPWCSGITNEVTKASDVLAQLSLFRELRSRRRQPQELVSQGVHPKRLMRAQDHNRLLKQSVAENYEISSTRNVTEILKCICIGMADLVYVGLPLELKGGDGVIRELGRDSIIKEIDVEEDVVIAVPYDLDVFHVVHLVTVLKRHWLLNAGRDVTKRQLLHPWFDPMEDSVVANCIVSFGSTILMDDEVKAPEHPQSAQIFAEWCASRMDALNAGGESWEQAFGAARAQQMRARRLNAMARTLGMNNDEPLFPVVSRSDLTARLLETLNGARCMSEVTDAEAFMLPALDEELASEVEAKSAERELYIAATAEEKAAADQKWVAETGASLRSVEVLGTHLSIIEHGFAKPHVEIAVNRKTQLHLLPDDGVTVDGEPLVVQLRLANSDETIAHAHIAQLKQDVRTSFIQMCLSLLPSSADAVNQLARLRGAIKSGTDCPDLAAIELCLDPVSGKSITAYGTLRVGSKGYAQDVWSTDKVEAETQHDLWLKWLAGHRVRMEKRRGYKQQADKLMATLRSLLVELAGTDVKTLGEIQPCMVAFQRLSFNRDASVLSWIEEASKLVDKTNKAAVAQAETRSRVAHNMLDRLSRLPESTEGYENAFDRIIELERIAAKTDVSRKVEILLAAREALANCESR